MNRLKNYYLLLICAMVLGTSQFAKAQTLKIPAMSPLVVQKQDFALSFIEVSYSRPNAKGRTIFGDLVPYNKLWRTGADASTKVTFGEDVLINGHQVPQGDYILLTIPEKHEWTVIISKDLALRNIANYNPALDQVKFKVKSKHLMDKVETFTIDINDITYEEAKIEIKWEHTAIILDVKANIDSQIMQDIAKAMEGDNKPYFVAALYYFNTDRDLNQALAWINEAIKTNDKAYWMQTLKARILFAMKDYAGATTAAEASNAIATSLGYETLELNNKIIRESKHHLKK